MATWCARWVEAKWFQRLGLAVILFAGVLVGVETNAGVMALWGDWLHALDRVVLGFFIVELGLRLGACWPRPDRFFRDAWNVFDFAVVAVCLLPFPTQFAAVLRLARVLRVLRLITAVPRLQILVGALLKSIPSMSYVALLLSLLFYIYAVLGVALFGGHDAEHFGSLGATALTLFQVVTLEGWADILRTQMAVEGPDLIPVVYFVSFILLGTMIMLNLLIGVIVNGMDEARQEMEDEDRARSVAAAGQASVRDELVALQRQLSEVQDALAALQRRLK